ncbi:MAG: hypothetical protein WCF66_24265 [Pseudolabrys sp.]
MPEIPQAITVLGRPRIVAAGPQLDIEVRRVEVDLADVEAPHGARASGRHGSAAEQRLREHDVGPAHDDKDREVLSVSVLGVACTGRHVQLGEYRHRSPSTFELPIHHNS